jgi:hypothetical protein
VVGHLLRIAREIGWIAAVIIWLLAVAVGFLAVFFLLLYKPWERFNARWRRHCWECEKWYWKSKPPAGQFYPNRFCSLKCEQRYFFEGDRYTSDGAGPYAVGAPRLKKVIQ